LIFLRICEDRGIEQRNTLKNCIKSGNFIENLSETFAAAQEKYNSGLFNLQKDTLSKLKLDNKVLAEVIKDLYERSAYDFKIMPVEILGFAYEQFLGKVIKIADSRNATIEDKPEVRKAGGVYYTPEYIVQYMVQQTVGRLVEGKTPEEVASIRILDPSCGSGPFLLGVYDFLLRWHTKAQKRPLTLKEKKTILLNTVFGIDLDPQAVEVAKLSLLIKSTEGETFDSVHKTRDHILPNMDDNIVCGNSLIEPDIYNTHAHAVADSLNPFDWNDGFKKVIKQGGFDVIIGNPPYISIENLDEVSRKYFLTRYETCEGRTDIYVAFIEKSLGYLKPGAVFSVIIPYAFTNLGFK